MQTEQRIHLLFVNVADDLITDSINIITEGGFNPSYNRVYSKTRIQEVLKNNANWDLILVSENPIINTFPILHYLKNHSENIPIIYLSREQAKEIAVPAMQNGADDCVVEENMGRLLPIAKRELENKRLRNKFTNKDIGQGLLSTTFNDCLDEIYIFGLEDLKCLYLNETALEKNKYNRQHIHQLSPTDIYVDYNPDEFKDFITPLLQGRQEKISVCMRKMGKNILNPSQTLFRLLEWNRQHYLLAINKDISSLQEKTRKLRKQQKISREYAASSKMKSEFLADAAHDIRTSLNSIILSNMLVVKRIGKDAGSDFRKLTSAIGHSSNYLLNYLDEFFDPPSEKWGNNHTKMSFIDAKVFGQRLFYIFDPVAQKNGITFEYKTPELVNNKIKTNPTYLRRILKNILSNAFKYTPHGSVTLRLYNPCHKELEKVHFNDEYAIAFQVQDTGIGIPKEEQSTIFERRTRTKHALMGKFKGSGLGLNICKQLTEALDGILHVESEENAGSIFTLYLPGQKPTKNDTGDSVSDRSSIVVTSDNENEKLDKTILVVDDSPTHNLAIKELLSYSIERCLTTTSKEQAYQLLEKENIDCIVLDYAINQESCIDIAEYIKSRSAYEELPIIIYTGKKLFQNEKQILNKYAQAIVRKKVGSYKVLTDEIRSLFTATNHP